MADKGCQKGELWHDTWVGEWPLKLRYDGLFKMAINKDGEVHRFWDAGTGGGSWDMHFHGRMGDEEISLSSNLLQDLLELKVVEGTSYCIIWSLQPLHSFSMSLAPKDLSFVGYTYKNFDAVKALYNDMKRSTSPKRPSIDSIFGDLDMDSRKPIREQPETQKVPSSDPMSP
ncbi:hypothetical protein QJS10_CPA06g01015 [Acorus calamus]|uniref:Uncharacterized protein n=1 Tax=Acorus calamus TaxID=4465 RepID=A0AAV9EPZ5_ACOCL|nr:hypothetical protein QJS10_CPA06g01015 [Acorus calamus]